MCCVCFLWFLPFLSLSAKDRFGQLFEPSPVLGIDGLGTAEGCFLREFMRCSVFGHPRILSRQVAGNLAPGAFAFLDVFTRPEWIERVGILIQGELFALDQRFRQVDR